VWSSAQPPSVVKRSNHWGIVRNPPWLQPGESAPRRRLAHHVSLPYRNNAKMTLNAVANRAIDNGRRVPTMRLRNATIPISAKTMPTMTWLSRADPKDRATGQQSRRPTRATLGALGDGHQDHQGLRVRSIHPPDGHRPGDQNPLIRGRQPRGPAPQPHSSNRVAGGEANQPRFPAQGPALWSPPDRNPRLDRRLGL